MFPQYFTYIDIIIGTILVLIICKLIRKYVDSPPGPYGLPLVGYFPFLGKEPMETIQTLSRKYNEIMCINLLGEDVWFLNSYDAAREALFTKGEIFSSRNDGEFSIYSLYGKDSFGMSGGEKWNEQSRCLLRFFSRPGTENSHFEAKVHSIVKDFENYIDQQNGEAHDYSNYSSLFSYNIVSELLLSKRYEPNDPTYNQISDWVVFLFHETFETFDLYMSGSVFKYYNKCKSDVQKSFIHILNKYKEYITHLLNEKQVSFDANNCTDLVDYWLKECHNKNYKFVKYKNLAVYLIEMLVSSDSMTPSIHGFFYLMALHPNVQNKMYQEIHENLGEHVLFSFSDRKRLPYTRAVISEVQRYIVNTPFSGVHVNNKETTVQGYKVRKGQKVIANLYLLMRNENFFHNPNQFDPNNFLDADGGYKPCKAFVPFGIGVRKCLAVRLSDLTQFTAFVSLIRKYEFYFADPVLHSNHIPTLKSFEVCIKRR